MDRFVFLVEVDDCALGKRKWENTRKFLGVLEAPDEPWARQKLESWCKTQRFVDYRITLDGVESLAFQIKEHA